MSFCDDTVVCLATQYSYIPRLITLARKGSLEPKAKTHACFGYAFRLGYDVHTRAVTTEIDE